MKTEKQIVSQNTYNRIMSGVANILLESYRQAQSQGNGLNYDREASIDFSHWLDRTTMSSFDEVSSWIKYDEAEDTVYLALKTVEPYNLESALNKVLTTYVVAQED
ncbi:hypothetical protein [Lysinibacillus xylanilyticus]|uniref:hypothetical protein n=1 Tax=Lysinibacillus xylanilyticus TaxID=582475 RepID=UPI003CFBEBC0